MRTRRGSRRSLVSSAGGVAASVAAAGAAQSVATDASTTPSSTHLTVAGSRNAVAVWAGDPYAASEVTWYLYVSVNGGAAAKVRMHPWGAHYVAASAGSTVSLGTSDGRTVSVAQATYPGTLAAPSGVTGTANCDKALPSGINSDTPLWLPSAGHVTLGSYNEVLQLNSDGTERWVFLRERDDDGTWTPIRAVLLQAATNVRVQCTYKTVALANEAGASLSVTVNTGGTVGGTSATMGITFPTVTGTSHAVTTVAELKTAIAAATVGDEIVLAAGTYSLDVAITQTSFTANNGATIGGRVRSGMEGIVIRGATGTATDVVLTGNGTSTNGDWTLVTSLTSLPAAAGTSGFKDLKFNFSAIDARLSLTGGRWRLQNVLLTGPASSAKDVIGFACDASYPIDFLAVRCDASNAGNAEDCWNAAGNAATNASSRARMVGCTGSAGDAAASQSQIVTSHTGLPLEVYGGTYSDANTNVFAPDATTTPQYVWFATITPGSHKSGIQNTNFYGCTITLDSASGIAPAQANGFLVFNKITCSGYAASASLFRSSGSGIPSTLTLAHNRLTATNGRAYFPSVGGGAAFTFNIVSGFGEGVRYNGYSAGSTSATTFHSNTMKSCTTAFNLDDGSMSWVLKNNACKTSGTSINCSATSMGLGTTNYNVLDPTVDADFVAGANDTTGSDAALDASDFPTASGNCDGNGDTSLVDWVGGSDPFGFALVYKSTRVSRGARDIAAIYSGAAVYPPVW